MTKYLYFEYQCGATKTVHGVVHAFLIFPLSSKVDILSCKVQNNLNFTTVNHHKVYILIHFRTNLKKKW